MKEHSKSERGSGEDDSATSAMAYEESSQSEFENDGWDHESERDEEGIEWEGEDTEGEDQSRGEEDRSDDNTMVQEYERLRQENIKKNHARL